MAKVFVCLKRVLALFSSFNQSPLHDKKKIIIIIYVGFSVNLFAHTLTLFLYYNQVFFLIEICFGPTYLCHMPYSTDHFLLYFILISGLKMRKSVGWLFLGTVVFVLVAIVFRRMLLIWRTLMIVLAVSFLIVGKFHVMQFIYCFVVPSLILTDPD